ncbi:MAG: hypothetical protein LBI27_02680 [Clostridiales bacterium]|jgi:hypothetical protein|nr:hypothetical protein [Clostridiales bacterium]
MAYLMCADKAVYETAGKKVLLPELMPCPPEHYTKWRNSRLFLRGINRLPEDDERVVGEKSTAVRRRMSLSDAYWIKNENDKADFKNITPYFNDFFEYRVSASKNSAPSVTLTGSAPKRWKRINGETVIYKIMEREQVQAEIAAITLAQKLNIPVNGFTAVSPTEIYINNFTSAEKMLMRLQTWDLEKGSFSKLRGFGINFSRVKAAYEKIGIAGNFHEINILFDAVVSNYDRDHNLTNWGYFKSAVDGSVSHCPMYDFNLALPYEKNENLSVIKSQLTDAHKNILRSWRESVATHGFSVWVENLDTLLM